MHIFFIFFGFTHIRGEVVLRKFRTRLIETGEAIFAYFILSLARYSCGLDFLFDAIENSIDFSVIDLVIQLFKYLTHVFCRNLFEVLGLFARSLLENDSCHETHEERFSKEDLIVWLSQNLFSIF